MLIIAVQGGKGGILKTGTAELISAWLDANAVTWRGADTDQENKTFNAIHGADKRVKRFDVYDRPAGRLVVDQVNALVDDIDQARRENVSVYVIDQGAGQGNVLRGAFAETGLLDEIKAGAIKLTIVFVTVNTDAALTTLLSNLETTFADVPSVEWVIVQNEFKGPLGEVFEQNPSLAKAVAARGARFARVPLVPDEARPLTTWENSGQTLTAFVASGPFAERGRIRTWMRGVHSDFDKLADVLRERADVTPMPAPPSPEAPSPEAPDLPSSGAPPRATGSKSRSRTDAARAS
jgi:hypothetical protein